MNADRTVVGTTLGNSILKNRELKTHNLQSAIAEKLLCKGKCGNKVAKPELWKQYCEKEDCGKEFAEG